ncbi:hypothetical protein PPYR_10253 [Photinus pyralis]|uniref:Uncharacterized protein n=2 Tax=Photinus pyralis TaxID=7054 RepID=A0A5N4AFS1_PHOPY|nr:hypothetical protein PPYR_10253 [Photinus pyralis]
MGPVGAMNIMVLESKPEDVFGDDVIFNPNLKSIDYHGSKSFSANLTTKIHLDSSITYKLELYQWTDFGCSFVMNQNDNFCARFPKNTPHLWENAMAALKPPVTEKFHIRVLIRSKIFKCT